MPPPPPPPSHSSSPGSWGLPAKHQSYSQREKEESEGGQEAISPGNASLAIPSLLERAGAQAPHPGVSLSRDWPQWPKLQRGSRVRSKVQMALRFGAISSFYKFP